MIWHIGGTRQHYFYFQRPLDREATVVQVCVAVGIEAWLLDRETAVMKFCMAVGQMQEALLFRSSRWVEASHMSTLLQRQLTVDFCLTISG